MKKINQSRMTQKEFIEFCQDKDKTYLATQLYQWKRKALINERKLQKVEGGLQFLFDRSFCKDLQAFCKFYDESYTPYEVFRCILKVFHSGVHREEFYQIVRSWIGGVEDE